MKGEFEKQLTSIHIEFAKLEGGESTIVKNLVRLEVIDEARKKFPKLEAGSFQKLPDGTINDIWAKEVIDWRKTYLDKE